MRELRHDPIQKRWVIIATDRRNRPIDVAQKEAQPVSNRKCPFCDGHEAYTPPEIMAFRAGDGQANQSGWKVRVVPNKFPALMVEGAVEREGMGHYDKMTGVGAHEVIVETPEHDKHLADFSIPEFVEVLRAYRERLLDLRRDPRLRYILIFKNYKEAAGASLAHPHTQVIATPITPRTVSVELETARDHYRLKERCLFCDILREEAVTQERIVQIEEHFVTLCPYASRFPFELMLAPRRHSHDFAAQSDGDLENLAFHFRDVLRRMKKGLGDPPYNFLLHTAPNTGTAHQRAGYWNTLPMDWHWHFEILPRLTSVAGFEWGTGFYINPTAPEAAAEYLREVDLG